MDQRRHKTQREQDDKTVHARTVAQPAAQGQNESAAAVAQAGARALAVLRCSAPVYFCDCSSAW
jgi:hypothetical protein